MKENGEQDEVEESRVRRKQALLNTSKAYIRVAGKAMSLRCPRIRTPSAQVEQKQKESGC